MLNLNEFTKQTLSVIVCVLGVLVLFNTLKIQTASHGVSAGETASLTLHFSNSNERVFSGPLIENMTILEALQGAAKGGGFTIAYKFNNTNDVNLEAIADKPNKVNGKSWKFYLNNKLIRTEDIDKIIIKKHDFIEAIYQ